MAGEMSELEQTAIGKAIYSEDLYLLKRLIATKSDVNRKRYLREVDVDDVLYKDKKGNTYLHYVCTMYRPFIFHTLVAADIDINAQNKDGSTALHVTALHNEPGHVADLMACGVDPFIRNKANKLAEEIPQHCKYWHDFYKKYSPGPFQTIEDHDLQRLDELIQNWCKLSVERNGCQLIRYAASKHYTDMVLLVDKMKPTLAVIYAVLEADVEKLRQALQKPCDVNFLNKGAAKQHILQYALTLGDTEMITLLCDAGADVNTNLLVHGYIRAPLYFEVINEKANPISMMTVLNSDTVDYTLKDESGRTALMYAMDKSNGYVSTEMIQYFIEQGVDIAERDVTGLTARDIAKLSRRKDIVGIIDQYMIGLIRSSDVPSLERLAQNGYDGFFFEYNYRDTVLYAAGNETKDVMNFLKQLKQFQATVAQIHVAAQNGDIKSLRNLLNGTEFKQEMLIRSKDKGGRTPLLKALLHGQEETAQYLLYDCDKRLALEDKDNLWRTSLHYAATLSGEHNMYSMVLKCGADQTAKDLRGVTSQQILNWDDKEKTTFLEELRNAPCGMELEISCVDKYEELRSVIVSQSQKLKHLIREMEDSKFSVADFPKILEPCGVELLRGFRDLVFLAIEHGKADLVKWLVQNGADTKRKEKCRVLQPDGTVLTFYMDAEEFARSEGYTELAEFILSEHIAGKGLKTARFTCTQDYADAEDTSYML
ncbi:uncharacterized protein LOC106155840 [Lingula anatina]|uniref:Uncharacterized protein LOC106155840 n=1 Tax=Lingula anatina TaxID=7574 RepID=A0A1S3HMM7_LINAN|nr:uncharacterized protein LOC106155840 [Lingula anatina]|eukprot:XP_013386309.1 uncharacterized protein LOC106155840 [Lingula anatina]